MNLNHLGQKITLHTKFNLGSPPRRKITRNVFGAPFFIFVSVVALALVLIQSICTDSYALLLVYFLMIWEAVYRLAFDVNMLKLVSNEGSSYRLRSPDSGIAVLGTSESTSFETEFSHDGLEETYPEVAFVIPSCNEPFEVAKLTIDSVAKIDYPGKKNIIVVDNSSDIDSQDFSQWKSYVESLSDSQNGQWMESHFLYNFNRQGLKPGNLDLAVSHLGESEYVVFLDVDSTLPSSLGIVQKAISEFLSDSSLGYIQFSTVSTNASFNPFTSAVSAYQNPVRCRSFFTSNGGFSLFYGHNSIWTARALSSVGDWLEYFQDHVMVTEDFRHGILAHLNGFYGKSFDIHTGEWVPKSLTGLSKMWMRWTYGSLQILHKYNFSLLNLEKMSFTEVITVLLHQVVGYLTSSIFLVSMIISPFFPEFSAIYMLLGYMGRVVSMAVSHRLHSQYLDTSNLEKLYYSYAGSFLISSYVSLSMMKASLQYIFGIPLKWEVTPKSLESMPSPVKIIWDNMFHIFVGLVLPVVSLSLWCLYGNQSFEFYLCAVGTLVHIINLCFCLTTFAKSDGTQDQNLSEFSIDRLACKAGGSVSLGVVGSTSVMNQELAERV